MAEIRATDKNTKERDRKKKSIGTLKGLYSKY